MNPERVLERIEIPVLPFARRGGLSAHGHTLLYL